MELNSRESISLAVRVVRFKMRTTEAKRTRPLR